MLDHQVQGVLALVRAALTGEARALPADFDLEAALEPISKHNIAVMALEGAVRCGLDKKLPAMQKLFVSAFQAIGRVEAQDRIAGELFAAFEAEGIDFMPVKGALLRGMYPKREYRSMGDMDVLIRVEQYERIRQIMLDQGFSAGEENDHVYVWRKDALMLELHKHLISLEDVDYYDYFGNGWRLAHSGEGSGHMMSDEDHYLYVVTHFAKHYRGGGVGIRQMCDLWLMRRAQAGMDEAYVCRELEKLTLYEFYENIVQTLKVWFEDGCASEKTDYISNVIYQSGAFGKKGSYLLSEGARLAGDKEASRWLRYKYLFRRAFLPLKDMQLRYPLLKKYPILLPMMWIYRGMHILGWEKEKVSKVEETFHIYNEADVKDYQRSLEYVGLRFRGK